MIYLVILLAAICAVLAYLLAQKLRVVTEIREVTLPASEPEPRVWQADEIEVRDRLLSAMESSAMRVAIESSTTSVKLASPDLKGRIIGRDGRNLKAFEQTTGVELLIDESDDTVTLSSFDPFRREVARQTLERLLSDGKIQPSKIEEVYNATHQSLDASLTNIGLQAAQKLGLTFPKPVAKSLGKLKFRTSFAQNVLDHSIETAQIAAQIAAELGIDPDQAKRAALLHDIGKALNEEGPHAITGMNFLQKHGESELVATAVGAHHHDIPPASPEARVLIIADTLSASRPGARREAHDNYIKRIQQLESIANAHPGVQKSYAIQAGRELTVIVKAEELSDDQTQALVATLGEEIAANADHKGQITITAIRETRFSHTIKT